MSATEAPYFLRVKGAIWNCEASAGAARGEQLYTDPLGQQT
jgi:hypothetical protein